jgi:hypothetical protein
MQQQKGKYGKHKNQQWQTIDEPAYAHCGCVVKAVTGPHANGDSSQKHQDDNDEKVNHVVCVVEDGSAVANRPFTCV